MSPTLRRAALPLLSLLVAAPGQVRAEEPPQASPRAQLAQAVADSQFGLAVLLCNDLLKTETPDLELRGLCGSALVGLGDRLLAAGSPANARVRWEEAATVDPRLLDDPAFVKRLADAGAATTAPRDESRPTPVRPRPPPKPTPKVREPRVRQPDDGPRFGRDFGLGLSFGFDGLASATLSWLSDQRFLVEVAFGIIYPSVDLRFRWLGLRHALTPYLGAGLFVPFGSVDRVGLDLSSYESLYELGESFHLDIGLAYMPVVGLDLSAGVALVTPFDQDHPDTVLFFPQLSASVTWRF